MSAISLRRLLPLLAVASLATLLSGCETLQSAVNKGAPPLAVDLKALDICKAILSPPELPPVDTKTNAVAAWARSDFALQGAIGTIGAGHDCVADVQWKYGGTKP